MCQPQIKLLHLKVLFASKRLNKRLAYETFPSKNGQVRFANIKIGNMELQRPLTKLCKLSVKNIGDTP